MGRLRLLRLVDKYCGGGTKAEVCLMPEPSAVLRALGDCVVARQLCPGPVPRSI